MVDIGLLLVCNLGKKCVCSSFVKEDYGSNNMFEVSALSCIFENNI